LSAEVICDVCFTNPTGHSIIFLAIGSENGEAAYEVYCFISGGGIWS
jgi:hypothetical protein